MPDYTTETPPDEPLEARFDEAFGFHRQMVVVLSANGTLSYTIHTTNGHYDEALSNLHLASTHRRPVWPRKARPGWQAEVLEILRNCVEVEEVR